MSSQTTTHGHAEMTFEDYSAECLRRQMAYIKQQRDIIAKAAALNAKYHREMGELGLHPLTRNEIIDRVKELDGMETVAPETYGDNEAMRGSWEMRFGDVANPSK